VGGNTEASAHCSCPEPVLELHLPQVLQGTLHTTAPLSMTARTSLALMMQRRTADCGHIQQIGHMSFDSSCRCLV
jgi:hypothetical protein